MEDHQKWRPEVESQNRYALSGKIMLSAIVVLFAVVVFMVGLHLYARWYLLRVRRRQLERRRQRRASRSQVLLVANGRQVPVSVVDRGLDITVLKSLPVSLYSSKVEQTQTTTTPPPTECAVCLSEFEEKEVVRLLPKCNHSFHIECIDMWFHSNSTCPLCRSPVEKVEETAENGTSSKPDCVPPPPPLGDRRKCPELVGVRIDVPPRVMPENELNNSSPASRLLALKRILSMGRKSPAGGASTTPRGAGTSRVAAELDLESGFTESGADPSRIETPTLVNLRGSNVVVSL